MKSLRFLLVFSMAMLVYAGVNAGPGEKVVLKMNLKKGDTYNYRFVADMKMNSAGDKKMDMKMNMEMEMGIHVDDVDQEGKYLFSYTFQNVKMNMAMDAEHNMTIDSKDPNDKDGKQMKAILNKFIFKALVWPSGKIAELKLDQFFDSLAVVVGKSAIDAGRSKFDSVLNSPEAQNSFKNTGYPEYALGVGDTWKPEIHESKYFKYSPNIEMRVNSISDARVVLGVKADISFSKEKDTMLVGMNMSGNYKIKGTTELDRITFMPVTMKGDADMDFSFSMKDSPMSMKMQMNFNMVRFFTEK